MHSFCHLFQTSCKKEAVLDYCFFVLFFLAKENSQALQRLWNKLRRGVGGWGVRIVAFV